MERMEIAIIGAGPGGIAAAIQLKRCGYAPILYEAEKLGGLLWNANLVENYPGFPRGIPGPELIGLMVEQINLLKIEVRIDKVETINSDQIEGFHLSTREGNDFLTKNLIVASGTKPKRLPQNLNSDEYLRDTINRDIRHLLDSKEKQIVIVGGGDAAFDHALYLSKRNKVTLLIRSLESNCLKLLETRAARNPKIKILYGILIESITKNCESQFIINCSDGKGKVAFKSDEIVFSIGREPNLDFYKGEEFPQNCLLVGDVKNGLCRQTSIAIGDGIKAAMELDQIIKSRNV